MTDEEAVVLGSIDPQLLGRRIRAARKAKGLTQGQLAASTVSIAYISRIEAGQRTPTPAVVKDLAQRLGVTVNELCAELPRTPYDEFRLTLDYAELALESGEAMEAEAQASSVAEALSNDRAGVAILDHALYVKARAFEAQGKLDDAIIVLEDMVENRHVGLDWVQACISLSRCYRETGDFGRAIELGERALTTLRELGISSSDEAIQLAVTMAASYFERGDVAHAIRLCRKAIASAEESGSAHARASAYWNASMLEAKEGSLTQAIPLARRALALLAEGRDARNLARLRAQLGIMLLHLDPPELEEAERELERAGSEFRSTSASPIDIARNDLARAHGMFLSGHGPEARRLIVDVLEVTRSTAPLIAADAQALGGQISAAEGDLQAATVAYLEAVQMLTGIGADRTAAQLWFELGELMDEIGQSDAARDAYRRAAASTGLQTRASVPEAAKRGTASAAPAERRL